MRFSKNVFFLACVSTAAAVCLPTLSAAPDKKKKEASSAKEVEAEKKRIDALIEDLGSRSFKTRSNAAKELEALVAEHREDKIGAYALSALQKTGENDNDVEVRAQVRRILEKLGMAPTPKNIQALIDEMKKTRDILVGNAALYKLIAMGEPGISAVENEFKPDPERFGKNSDKYALDIALGSDAATLAPGDFVTVTAKITNAGKKSIWFNPLQATMTFTCNKQDPTTTAPDDYAELLFKLVESGRNSNYTLLHLEPGEELLLTYETSPKNPGVLRCEFSYAVAASSDAPSELNEVDREKQAAINREKLAIIARVFGQEIPPVLCSPTPFGISETLVIEVKGTAKSQKKYK